MNIFLICPVRGKAPDAYARIVQPLEADGHRVHWPPRDTNQDDDTGLRICRDNLAAIVASDCVYVIWDGQSQGCLFDLGMAFALGKKIVPLELPTISSGKSFQNMIRAAARGIEASGQDAKRLDAKHESPTASPLGDAPKSSLEIKAQEERA